jgi:hypothetical protein
VILLVGVASSCPSVCSCSNHLVGVNVDCSNRGLDSIPPDIPKNTCLVDFGHYRPPAAVI